MSFIVTIVHVGVSFFLMLTVLLQAGKGGGMGATFGGGSSQGSVFGGSGAGNFLSKLTTISASIFMMTSMTLAYLASTTGDDSLKALSGEARANATIKAKLDKAATDSLTPAEVTPAEVTPAEVTPAEVTPAGVTPAEVTPSGEATGDSVDAPTNPPDGSTTKKPANLSETSTTDKPELPPAATEPEPEPEPVPSE